MKKIFLILIMVLAAQLSFAETIKLKSGKSVTGKIVEKNDKSVKVDIEGVPVTYYLDAIESIDGKALSINPVTTALPSKTQTTSSVAQEEKAASSTSNWQTWFSGVSGYLAQVQALSMELRQIGYDSQQKMQSLDQASKAAAIEEVLAKTMAVKQRGESLTPPPELKEYHSKFLKSVDIYLALVNSLKTDPNASHMDLFKELGNNALEIMEETRRVFVKQGIPPELLAKVDAEIEKDKQALDLLEQRLANFEENRKK
ncbi:MAG: hypothetical protein PHP17_03905 [Candidatus Omnitrophica bacterium]|nr:hypothetical protein [Candidatus Omnitrophota bacterium]